jgi:hypothetical protein
MLARSLLARCAFALAIPLAIGNVSISVGQLVASFHDDFQPATPATGWSYLWNANGPIGNVANYLPLIPSASGLYTADGSNVRPAPAPGSYATIGTQVGEPGGHPGMGVLQNGSGGIERYCIALYTLTTPNQISILDGVLRNINQNSGGSTDGLALKVYVNDSPLPVLDSGTAAGFDQTAYFNVPLGNLSAGDRIYVAVGSRNSDAFDGFNLRYNIVAVPEPVTASILVAGMIALVTFRPAKRRGYRAEWE